MRRGQRFKPLLTPFLLLLTSSQLAAQVEDELGDNRWADLVATIDSIATGPIEDGKIAGASVAVVKGRDTIALKAYGHADLEYRVPTPDRAIYEIGSVTKQFTAAALLQLAEQGRVDLDAEIREYLPDFPTQGNTITVRRLLDHTSGIRGYTEIPEVSLIFPRKLPRDSLVALFAAKPFDFPTGEHMIYNNSAYFLAGLIIEHASGQTYESYVEDHLFEVAGMPDSRYCSESEVYERRAHGYDTGPDGLVRKGYLVHLWPFAAGSLCSTASDLVAWNRALHGGDILNAESYQELITPGVLTDGTRLRYAKGLAVSDVVGRRAIHHGGGIPGFLSQSTYFPDDDLIVVVLLNTAGPVDPGQMAEEIAEAVLGEAPKEGGRYSGDLSGFVGSYHGPARGSPVEVSVSIDDGALSAVVRPESAPEDSEEPDPMQMRHLDGATFVDDAGSRYTFVREGGSVIGLRLDMVYGYSRLTRREP